MTFVKLFIRQGFNVVEVQTNQFDCGQESEENIDFLLKTLDKGSISYHYHAPTLTINDAGLAEDVWIQFIDVIGRGKTEMLYSKTWSTRLNIEKLDTYISGVVNELNRLGLYTGYSCDGHGKHPASISLVHEQDLITAARVLTACGVKRIRTNRKMLTLNVTKQGQMLDVAEKLHCIKKEWLTESSEFLEQQLFYVRLEEVLSVSGVSGNEQQIRCFVMEQLTGLVDHMTVDEQGNVLAHKTYRNGNGPTILLNAHLDSVEELVEGREIIKNGSIWSSSEGILSADDKAGVAVLLAMAHWLSASTFNGKVKFIFTVKEEVGLIGARSMVDYFLWGVDAAIVVDRRNTNDIVVSCGGYIPFCHEDYGKFFEEVAEKNSLGDWKMVAGGSSDTKIWAEHGIQSVNLSAGYNHEHTDAEILNVDACYNVFELIQGVFKEKNELSRVLSSIHRMNRTEAVGIGGVVR